MKIVVVVWLALVACAVPARAQDRAGVPASEFDERLAELATWLQEYEAWERWFEMWGNRVARNFNDRPLFERRQRPTPPAWLGGECQYDWAGDGLMPTACHILRHWDEQPLRILQRRDSSLITSSGRADDRIVKSSFLQRVHVTGLWMEARYPATPAYGVVGMQIGVFEAGRFTLPAVGVMVVVTPDGQGGHAWRPATTVGFGYRLLDFVPPLLRMQASLHLNVATVQLHGGHEAEPLSGFGKVNLFGLSVSTRRR